MKKTFDFSCAAALAALMTVGSLGLASCSDDTLDTNPYNRSGVNIVAMGPMPVSRGDQIRISGTRLNEVKAVVFPGSKDIASDEESTIEVTDFKLSGNDEMTVRVPDYALAGHVTLLTKSGETITSLSRITYVEPIEVDEVSPLTDLAAGDIVTVKGDYIWNIATATFTDGVVVESSEFIKVNRVEAQFAVPVEAVSGTLVLSDGNEANPQEFTFDVTIHTTRVSGLDKSLLSGGEYEFGEMMTITGQYLNLVETVTFPAGIDVPFEVNDEGTELKVEVPGECCSGEVQLTQYSGVKVNTPAYAVPTVAVYSVNGSANGAKDVMTGDMITLKGKNFDRIRELYFMGSDTPASADEYKVVDPEILTFEVKEGMADGNIRIVQNNSISVESPSIAMKKMGNVVWSGNVECKGWSGSFGIYTWSGADWDKWTKEIFTSPGTLTLTIENPNGCLMKITRTSDWGTGFDNIWTHPYHNGSNEPILSVPAGVTKVEFDVTADDIAAIQQSGFTFYGDGFVLKMIEYKKVGGETTVFEPNQDMGNYTLNLEMKPASAFVDAGVKEGMYMHIYCTPTADYNYDNPQVHIQIFDGHWGGLTFPECNGGQFNESTWGDMSKIDIYINAELAEKMTTLTDWGYCMIFQGNNIILNKVTVGN